MTSLTTYEAPSSPVEIRFSDDQMKVITSTIAKGATPEELQLFVSTCTRTGLDPFLKQIYAVKRWDSREKREVMAIQVGIDGLRLIADRTGKYGGQDPIEWLDENGVWSEVWTGSGDHPVAARTAVYRKDWSHKAPAVCRWDSYAQTHGADAKLMPNWAKMPDVMLGKCAEALALRRAFPAEMSGVAAQVGYDYDPETEAVYQQRAVDLATRETGRAEAIEGEVVKHHDMAPVEDLAALAEEVAADRAVAATDGPADEAVTNEARQKLFDAAIRIKKGGTMPPSEYGAVIRGLREKYNPGGDTFSTTALSLEAARSALAELLEAAGEAGPPEASE